MPTVQDPRSGIVSRAEGELEAGGAFHGGQILVKEGDFELVNREPCLA